MGNYNLDRLGTNEFEHLVQALSTKIFKNQNIVFGSGRDGAREATFTGKSSFAEGYHVIQAKFKDDFESQDWKWAKQQFQKEMNKFKNETRDLPTPDVYLFFTNIQFTAVSKVGGRDEIEEFKKEYIDFIPNIMIYGYDEICKLLDNNRDVATSYASFILSGDIIQELYNHMNITNSRDNDILYRFLNKEFDENLYSKLEQAGKVTDDRINLERVFVDLNISGDEIETGDKFINFCLDIGNSSLRKEPYKMVFIGGPGQGKSTITQFLTQVYRVKFLETFQNKTLSDNIQSFKKQISKCSEPKCYRFPVNIILSDYSEWLSREKEKDKSYSVLSYIQYRIQKRADDEFSEFNNFRSLLSSMSFLFIFDGLDEVPTTSNRQEVIVEIDNFINYELKSSNCDAMVIATTRPQGYSDEFSREKKFKHFELDDLDRETCLEYLDNLVKNTVHSNDEIVKQLKILRETLDNEVTANLMKTPLQATIMAILVKSGGKPSKDKFSLFDDYYKTMLKREKQKNVLKIIGEHEDYINEIHYKLGNTLQLTSQEMEHTSSYLDMHSFKSLVEEYFDEQELDASDKKSYTEEIMEAITDRLVFITENQDNKIGFAIRSTQEYFSAMMNVHNIHDETVIKNLKVISESIYWRNVFIFMLGYIAKNKNYLLDTLDSHIYELNGSSINSKELSLSKISKYGSLLSLEILAESILSHRPKQENKLIKHLKLLTDIISIGNSDYLLRRLKSKVINDEMVEVLLQGVQSSILSEKISSWNMIAVISEQDEKFFNQFQKYWIKDENEEFYYLELFLERNIFIKFILERACKYLNYEYLHVFESLISIEEFIEALINSNILDKNIDIKLFLVQFIFFNHRFYPFNHKPQKCFFKLLDIETESTLESFKEKSFYIAEFNLFKVSMIKIKDLRDNQVLIKVYNSTKKYQELLLLNTLFNYLVHPSIETLKECYHQIKLEYQSTEKGGMYLYAFEFNWQLSYIINAIRNEVSEEVVHQELEEFGMTFDNFIDYERTFDRAEITVNNLKEFMDFELNNDVHIVDFYKEVFFKNKKGFSHYLLHEFLFHKIDNVTLEREIIFEVIELYNDLPSDAYLKFPVLIKLISLLDMQELLKENFCLDLNVEMKFQNHLIRRIGDNLVSIALQHILNFIYVVRNGNEYVKIIFMILNQRITLQNNNLKIMLEISYKNVELKIYGYLLTLVDKSIFEDMNQVNKVMDFLLENIEKYNKFEDTLNFVRSNSLKGRIIENFLFEVYKRIHKNSIENCKIASTYQDYFKNIFENKVIEL